MPVIVDERTDEEVDCALVERHREVCVALAGLLEEVAEHDRRGLFRRHGARNEAEFLRSRFDAGYVTANAWMRVSHALPRLGDVATDFREGLLTFDKVVALVDVLRTEQPQVVTPADPFSDPAEMPPPPEPPSPAGDNDSAAAEPEPQPSTGDDTATLDLSDVAHGSTTRDLVAEARRRARASAEEAHTRMRRQFCHLRSGAGDVRLGIESLLFDDSAATVQAAFHAYAESCGKEPDGTWRPLEQRYADALIAMAGAYLADRDKATNRPGMIVHVDARVLAGDDAAAETAGYSPLAAETARRLACQSRLALSADDPEGTPLNLGRTQYRPSWQLEALVRRAYDGCGFGGCETTFGIEIHHIEPWEFGGLTNFDNLCPLCGRHHHLCHEGGWKLRRLRDGTLEFTSPDGFVLRSPPRLRRPGAISIAHAQPTLI